jgi:hypothetical protein
MIIYLKVHCKLSKLIMARCPWFMPIILATWEAEIQRIVVLAQPGQIVHETPKLPEQNGL